MDSLYIIHWSTSLFIRMNCWRVLVPVKKQFMYKAKTQTSQIRKVFKKEIKYKNINNKNNINNSNKNIDLFITYKFLCIGHFHHTSKI